MSIARGLFLAMIIQHILSVVSLFIGKPLDVWLFRRIGAGSYVQSYCSNDTIGFRKSDTRQCALHLAYDALRGVPFALPSYRCKLTDVVGSTRHRCSTVLQVRVDLALTCYSPPQIYIIFNTTLTMRLIGD